MNAVPLPSACTSSRRRFQSNSSQNVNTATKDAPGGALGCLMATANRSFSSRAAASAASLSFFCARHK